MNLKKLTSTAMAITFSLYAVTATAWAAPLLEASSDDPQDYFLEVDEYIDYTKVASIEAVVTAESVVEGTIAVTDLEGNWVGAGTQVSDNGTSVWKLDGLNGIFAIEDVAPAVVIQVWYVSDGTYSIDSLTLYDADGNEIVPSDTPVERPNIKFPDAQREDIDNDAFEFPGKLDIEKAVGEDFGSIGAIEFTLKWNGENAWNGSAVVYGLQTKGGDSIGWMSYEIGNINENECWVEVGNGEGTYRFDFSEDPVVGLTAFGLTGEISSYAALCLEKDGEYGEEPSNPQISNVTFYNTDGAVIASLDYKTIYDEPEPTDEPETPDATEAGRNNNTSDKNDSDKSNPDTGAADIAVAVGSVALAGVGVLLASKKRR